MIDPGSTHSFIAQDFLQHVDTTTVHMNFILTISTPLGKTALAELVCETCALRIGDRELTVDLIMLNFEYFDIILGMDFLAPYHAAVHYYTKKVTFQIPGQVEFSFQGTKKESFPCLILAIQAGNILRKGGQGYLTFVTEDRKNDLMAENVPIVREFTDVFPKDLPGLPPDREIEFVIDLVLGTGPISIAPYRMTPVEFKELKVQL